MKKRNGSALIWSMALILIFVIFSVAIITIASKMSIRSINNNTIKQLRLTSESAVEVVVESIQSNINGLCDYVTSSTADIINPDFFDGKDMKGQCKVTVRMDSVENKIFIVATTTSEELSETVSAVMVGRNKEFRIGRYSNSEMDKLIEEENI